MGKSFISRILQRLNLDAFMISSVYKTADINLIFSHPFQHQINIEFINQVSQDNGSCNVFLCLDSSKMYSASTELERIKPLIKAHEIVPLHRIGILSIFPHKEHALVINTIIQSLNQADIWAGNEGGSGYEIFIAEFIDDVDSDGIPGLSDNWPNRCNSAQTEIMIL